MPLKHLFFSNQLPPEKNTIWGEIIGNLAQQLDLSSALEAKSDISHNHDNLYEPKNSNIQNHILSNYLHLPNLSNNSGKILKNDGVAPFWENLPQSLSIISSNTTYYVKNGAVDNIISFNTLQDALNSLNSKYIQPNAILTIEIDDGVFNCSNTITINHPNSSNIRITGKNSYDINISQINSVSGSQSNYSITITCSDVSNIAVGDFIYVKTASFGANGYGLKGLWKITAVTPLNNRITINNSSYLTISAATGSGNATIIKSVLKFTNINGIDIQSPLIGMSKLVIEGNLSSAQKGIIQSGAFFKSGNNLGIYSFEKGVQAICSNAILDNIIISKGNNSNSKAIEAVGGSSISAQNAMISGNYIGIYAYSGSRIDIRYASIIGNFYGFYAIYYSFIQAYSSDYQNSYNSTPDFNVIGNYNSLVNTL